MGNNSTCIPVFSHIKYVESVNGLDKLICMQSKTMQDFVLTFHQMTYQNIQLANTIATENPTI